MALKIIVLISYTNLILFATTVCMKIFTILVLFFIKIVERTFNFKSLLSDTKIDTIC